MICPNCKQPYYCPCDSCKKENPDLQPKFIRVNIVNGDEWDEQCPKCGLTNSVHWWFDESFRQYFEKKTRPITENRIKYLLILGKSNEEIAKDLNITVHGVKYHITNMLKNSQVKTRAEYVSKYINESNMYLIEINKLKSQIELLKEELEISNSKYNKLLTAGSNMILSPGVKRVSK